MTLRENRDIIIRWIRSCDKDEQVDMLIRFVAEMPESINDKDKPDTELVKDELIAIMAEQKIFIKRTYFLNLPAKPALA